METKVIKYIEKNRLFQAGDRVLIGVSGGADSLALLYFLICYREYFGIEIGAAHLHHDLRGKTADEDAEFVRVFCADHGVPFYFDKKNVREYGQKHKIGIEAAGRQLRYAFFERIMSENDYEILATAHHMNDQAETVLMRMLRGSGIKGAAGILPKEGKKIHPLLGVSRSEIEMYCREHELAYRHDSTNDDRTLTRNFLRHEVFPQLSQINGNADRHIAQLAEILSEYNDFFDKIIAERSNQLIRGEKGRCVIDVSCLKQEDHLLRCALLRRMIALASDSLVDIEKEHIEQIDQQLLNKAGNWRMDLPRQICVLKRYNDLIVEVGTTAMPVDAVRLIEPDEHTRKVTVGDYSFLVKRLSEKDLKLCQNEKKHGKVYIDYDKINDVLEFRIRKSGDYIFLKGMTGRKKIKNLFIDRKLPREERDRLPLLALDHEILWVPGLAVNSKYSVNENTQQILQISMESGNEQRC